jgi:hypothetical protein
MDLNIVLFKTDTQGFELDVLEGSKALLTDGKNAQAVIVEVSHGLLKSKQSTIADLLRKVMRMGYACTTMGWHGVVSRNGNDNQYGYVASPPLSDHSFSPEELERSLEKIGPTNLSGWTDVLCVPM